jgi:NADH:ubiquinone oxidoreductase subunit 6 (subunit J)
MDSQKPDELLPLGLTFASLAGVFALGDADHTGPMLILVLATACFSVCTVRATKRR